MKKFIAFLSCLIITATMASCYNNTNDDDMKDHGSTGTTEVPSHDELENNEMSEQDKIAWQAYREAIKNERAIYQYSVFSSTSSTPPSASYFIDDYGENISLFKQAMIDMDQDGISELILKQSYTGHYIILHYDYDNDRVYYNRYLVPSNNSTIYTDGSFSWSNYSHIFGNEYGISRITYLNGKPKYQELCRVESAYNMYYVNGAPVTEEEYDSYIESTTRTPITFSPIDLSLLNSDENKALSLASEYWNIKDGDFDPQNGARYQLHVEKKFDEDYCYTVHLYTALPGRDYECIACAYVDINTEEITEIKYPNGKG